MVLLEIEWDVKNMGEQQVGLFREGDSRKGRVKGSRICHGRGRREDNRQAFETLCFTNIILLFIYFF